MTKLPSPNLRLQPRDERLLEAIYLHRVLTRDQIVGLGFFGSASASTSRLAKLSTAKFVRQFGLVGPSGQSVYGLGKSSAAIVADRLDSPFETVVSEARRETPPLFLAHTFAVTDLRIAFEKTERVSCWLPEILCRHEYSVRDDEGKPWRKHALKPDAYVRLGEDHYFIEVDLGNVSLPKFAAKVASYRRYQELELFEEVYGAKSFGVLVVTTGERRLKGLSGAAKSGTFLFSTFDLIAQHGATGPIWRSDPNAEPKTLGGRP